MKNILNGEVCVFMAAGAPSKKHIVVFASRGGEEFHLWFGEFVAKKANIQTYTSHTGPEAKETG